MPVSDFKTQERTRGLQAEPCPSSVQDHSLVHGAYPESVRPPCLVQPAAGAGGSAVPKTFKKTPTEIYSGSSQTSIDVTCPVSDLFVKDLQNAIQERTGIDPQDQTLMVEGDSTLLQVSQQLPKEGPPARVF